MALPETDAGRKREVGEGGGLRGLLAMRGMKRRDCWNCADASSLYTFPFLFFSLLSPSAERVRVSATGRTFHGFGALTTTLLVTPGFGFSRLRWGKQEREQLSLLLVGFLVTRAVCRGPSKLLLETTISQNDCSLEE